ncbi:MAG: hypothetical protein ACLFUR_06445 [Candidatus Hadarchaeia archaeon]
MPTQVKEEKEGRIAYENMVKNILERCNDNLQMGKPKMAYMTLRDLYTSLIKRHREKWLEKVKEKYSVTDGVIKASTAKRMLDPQRPFDHYLNTRNHKRWMALKRAFTDMCHDEGLFFHSRQVEVGRE